MKHKLLYSMIAFSTVGIIIGSSIYIHLNKQNKDTPTIQTVHPKKSDPLLTSGTVKATNQKNFESTNTNFEMKVANEEKVSQGALIAVDVDDEAIKNAKTGEQEAITDLTVAKNMGDKEDIQDAQKALEKAHYKASTTPPTETAYYAPFDGTITYDRHNKGVRSYKITSNEKYIESNISDFDYDKIKEDMPVTVKPNTDDKTTNETINFISSEGNTEGKFTKYEFNTSADPNYRLGQQVTLSIKQSNLWIPKSAVVVINNTTARVRLETPKGDQTKTIHGKMYGNKFIISSGLTETDKVKIV